MDVCDVVHGCVWCGTWMCVVCYVVCFSCCLLPLQRLVEDIEYVELLDRAAGETTFLGHPGS